MANCTVTLTSWFERARYSLFRAILVLTTEQVLVVDAVAQFRGEPNDKDKADNFEARFKHHTQ